MVLTGSQTIWGYVFEDDDAYAQDPGTPADTTVKAFGHDEDVQDPELQNNEETLYRPFDRQPAGYLETDFAGTWGTDFIYTDPEWLQFVFGPDNSGTYDIDPQRPPASAQLIKEVHFRDGTVQQTVYTGVGADSASLSTSVQDTLDVSLSGFYADQETFTDASSSPLGAIGSQPTVGKPLNFANSELYIGGTLEARVQDFDLTFGVNSEPDYEIGTRFATDVAALEMQPDLSYTARIEDVAADPSVYGTQAAEEDIDADIAGSVEVFGHGGGQANGINIEFTESILSSHSLNGIGAPDTQIDKDIDRALNDLTVTVV